MPLKHRPLLLTLPALLSPMLLAGCWSATAPLAVAVPPPPLPVQARQKPEAACNPTCSAVLAKKLDAMQPSPTGLGLQVKPAKPATTQP